MDECVSPETLTVRPPQLEVWSGQQVFTCETRVTDDLVLVYCEFFTTMHYLRKHAALRCEKLLFAHIPNLAYNELRYLVIQLSLRHLFIAHPEARDFAGSGTA